MFNSIVVEYSKSQRAFHRCTVSESLANEAFYPSDYKPIGFFKSQEEADAFIDRNYQNINRHGFFVTDIGKMVYL